jgi:hypothetical protein
MTKTELRQRALQLPENERRALGMALIDSTLPPLSAGQKRLIDDRLAAYETNPDSWLSQEQFDVELDERLARS